MKINKKFINITLNITFLFEFIYLKTRTISILWRYPYEVCLQIPWSSKLYKHGYWGVIFNFGFLTSKKLIKWAISHKLSRSTNNKLNVVNMKEYVVMISLALLYLLPSTRISSLYFMNRVKLHSNIVRRKENIDRVVLSIDYFSVRESAYDDYPLYTCICRLNTYTTTLWSERSFPIGLLY